jgi:hypothetical protein
MELSPSWEAASCATTQNLPSILWNLKVLYRVHKIPPLAPLLNQINLIHTILSCLSKIHFLTFQLPNLISIFFRLGRLSTESVQDRGFLRIFVTSLFFLRRGIVSPTLNSHAGGPPLVGCTRLLIQYIRSNLHNWRVFPPSAIWGRAMPWWRGTHVTWLSTDYTALYPRRLLILFVHCAVIFHVSSVLSVSWPSSVWCHLLHSWALMAISICSVKAQGNIAYHLGGRYVAYHVTAFKWHVVGIICIDLIFSGSK